MSLNVRWQVAKSPQASILLDNHSEFKDLRTCRDNVFPVSGAASRALTPAALQAHIS